MATNFAEDVTNSLIDAGCDKAFGLSGGYISGIWKALDDSQISVYHFRHETGAVFAAMEHSLHTEKITVVFTTCGPGITNSITGLRSARADGARVVFISALTTLTTDDESKRSIQETTPDTVERMTGPGINNPLSQSIVIRSAEDLRSLKRELSALQNSPIGGVIGVFFAPEVQKWKVQSTSGISIDSNVITLENREPLEETKISDYADILESRLQSGRFILWIGYGARRSAEKLLQLADRYHTPVVSTPRGKGIFPENHPLYRGVTGVGGTIGSTDLVEKPPHGVIVLGTSLAEFSSFHIQLAWTETEIICISLKPDEMRRNLPPNALVLEADINKLLQHMTNSLPQVSRSQHPPPTIPWKEAAQPNQIHPQTVMSVVQEVVINQHNLPVFVDIGNSLCWATHHLRFTHSGKYRVSVNFASMGHACCGAVGLASSGMTAVAIVGDGAMLMQSEVSSAVQYGFAVIWLVMNDARYNMCYQGPRAWGQVAPDCNIPEVDFAMYAKALGCQGRVARTGEELKTVLEEAILCKKPFVVDVKIDPDAFAPSEGRAKSLQAVGKA
ncbi:hypothetical protein VTL71DRAFT_10390 [Oculimacula yallundae]|uniref:Pyruvate decarboxylase n=1 Tax=Oculimacula yallundae TaxID=86028 RepID=A0ABR4CV58_9HELO